MPRSLFGASWLRAYLLALEPYRLANWMVAAILVRDRLNLSFISFSLVLMLDVAGRKHVHGSEWTYLAWISILSICYVKLRDLVLG